ncbi:alpha/beta fold hydrolase [Spirosoma endbachense]|uniref:Alpha/beta fold hydrolase n=1 Tax=Spirosoma endbachense TaxID=2666025 RepID=A0A6P1VW91_9BACT|nr:alpha/beta fold hydrolase [Spirosoma endbachense]
MLKLNNTLIGALLGLFFTLISITQVEAQTKSVKNIVLVHGAFADGSSWAKVIPLLLAKGLNVTAVQNPLTSLQDDVAATKRAIALMDGPVLLVGHSWAGVVISEAGNDPKVAGLLYVAAFAPDNGQSLSDVAKTFPPGPGNDEVRPDAAGFLSLTPKGIHEDFAQDLPESERRVILATQGQWAAVAPGEKIAKAAWRQKPAWYIVAKRDRMINPDLERAMAKTIKATAIELDACHIPMVSQPKKVASFIIEAASNVSRKELVSN